MNEKTDIQSMDFKELTAYVTDVLGEKPFRARQIYEWIHVKLVSGFDEMTNLSKILKGKAGKKTVTWPCRRLPGVWSQKLTEPVNICSAFPTAILLKVFS